MSEFFRGVQWASTEAKAIWELRIQAAASAWNQLESLSVTAGIRDSALFSMTTKELVAAARAVGEHGLEITVVDETLLSGTYQSATPEVGSPGLRVAVHRRGLGHFWHDAWIRGDNDRIGQMLGFPKCCRGFFDRVWTGDRLRDTTSSMGGPIVGGLGNILLRWIGVRLVPHLPCSFSCPETLRLAERFLELGKASGLAPEMAAMEQLLALPMTYSALHGIGLVETPFFRFGFSTDWTPDEQRIVIAEGFEPRPFATEEVVPEPLPQHPWEDNGFALNSAMGEAHTVVTRAFQGKPADLAIDLGCGDGTLLNTLRMAGLIRNGIGIDSDAGRIERGRGRYPDLSLFPLSIQDWARKGEEAIGDVVVLFMPGRLEEMATEDAERVLERLRRMPRVILYCYQKPVLGARAKLIGAKTLFAFEKAGFEAAPVDRWEDPPPCETKTCQGTACGTPAYLPHHHDSVGEPPHGTVGAVCPNCGKNPNPTGAICLECLSPEEEEPHA